MPTYAAPALALFLSCTALGHFVFPAYFRTLVPAWLPSPAIIVAASGLAELAVAGLLSAPPTRTAGGWAATALIAAFLTSHLDAARRTRSATRPLDTPWGVAARLGVNACYVVWAAGIALC